MKMPRKLLLPVALALPLAACAQPDLSLVELPDGFSIDYYAEGVENARQMALGDEGTLFVGSRRAGKVHAVVDSDGDFRADRVILIADGLEMPSGIEFREGDLYVAAVSRVLRYPGIESRLDNPPEPEVLVDDLPTETHHGWKYLRFSPAGELFLPVGAPCNVCDEPGFAEVRRLDLESGQTDTWAYGVRNSVGLAFHPQTAELWFTDNGRDWMGDDLPDCELNHAPEQGMHFGFPYCHQGDVPDPDFGEGKTCADYVAPEINLGPHVAPLGLAFYTGDQFPADYRGDLIIAEHGSWNRSDKIGYRLKRVTFEEGEVTGQEVFAEGWLQGQEDWGRPNDVLVLPDGSLLVSDDKADAIYRIIYTGG
ncbi:MAG: PQQ-dependent sugar dehydrogenase [Xanthomonadales bacterium]|jgi:glucose/arabinose dehydrogenase|nr:PQQ-dependent sugar dehydrogenase [Xanthomonadales bacterium]